MATATTMDVGLKPFPYEPPPTRQKTEYGQNNAIVGSTTGSNYYVRILSTINRELLKPSAYVALHRHSNALVDVLLPEADSSISLLSQSEKPDVTYNNTYNLDKVSVDRRRKMPLNTGLKVRKPFSVVNGGSDLPPTSVPPICSGSESGVNEFTKEDVEALLNEKLKVKNKFNYKILMSAKEDELNSIINGYENKTGGTAR
ncbi:hypothetical protein OROHE_007596 [Orobanche hederae]